MIDPRTVRVGWYKLGEEFIVKKGLIKLLNSCLIKFYQTESETMWNAMLISNYYSSLRHWWFFFEGVVKTSLRRGAKSFSMQDKSCLLTQYIFGSQLSQILELEIDVNDGHAACDYKHDYVTAVGLLEENRHRYFFLLTVIEQFIFRCSHLGWPATPTPGSSRAHSPPRLWGTHSSYTSACWQPGCS